MDQYREISTPTMKFIGAAGYINYEEAIKISVDACRVLQANYSSWDHMMNSYFLGLAYWNGAMQTSPESRKLAYEAEKNNPNGIYSIPWDTNLDEHDFIAPRKNEGKNVKLA